MPNFEVFTQKRAGAAEGPTLTIQRRGGISMNQIAFEQLGGPRFVELLFDPAEQVIGIRPVDGSEPHHYQLQPQGSKYRTSYSLSGNAFLNHYKLSFDESIRRDAVLDDGVLTVSLRDPGVIVTARRREEST